MFKVKILKDCKQTGVKAGEIYDATRYPLDPQAKVTLYKDGEAVGNAYWYEVEKEQTP